MPGTLEYRSSDLPDAPTLAALYDAAGLGRPTADLARFGRMVQGANVTLACFERLEDGGERIVGFLRGWTDFAFDGLVCEVAVHPDLAHRGVGPELLQRATSLGAPEVEWLLPASALGGCTVPAGWERLADGWTRPRMANP